MQTQSSFFLTQTVTAEEVQDFMATALAPFATYNDIGNVFNLAGINAHSDVDTVTVAPVIGQTLIWNGSNWVPSNVAAGAPTIQMVTTPTSVTIGPPLPLVNTPGFAPLTTTFVNPSSTNSMKIMAVWDSGEIRVRFDSGDTFNAAMRLNARVNAVTVNAPADFDRRMSRSTPDADQFEITTATKAFRYITTVAPSSSTVFSMDYDLNFNIAPSLGASNNLRFFLEPSTITIMGWLI